MKQECQTIKKNTQEAAQSRYKLKTQLTSKGCSGTVD